MPEIRTLAELRKIKESAAIRMLARKPEGTCAAPDPAGQAIQDLTTTQAG
jgi:hypothetical protein